MGKKMMMMQKKPLMLINYMDEKKNLMMKKIYVLGQPTYINLTGPYVFILL
jgi:hypothetical protein